jgi:iron-sulfur cluster assembly accessory protein
MEAPIFLISDNAAKRIEFLLTQESLGAVLKISVDGGGCSGFKYKFEFTTEIDKNDVIFTNSMAKVVIDELSLNSFMKGSILDYIQDLSGAEFVIKNPNASVSCGCGNSFSI